MVRLNYCSIFSSSLSLPSKKKKKLPSDVNRKICHIFTLCIRTPSSLLFFSLLLHPLLSNMWENKKKSQFLKVLGAKKNKKKGCYLIKEAAINLSRSSAAPLHIWPLAPATRCCSFSHSPGWDLWFLLLVSHVVSSPLPAINALTPVPAPPDGWLGLWPGP